MRLGQPITCRASKQEIVNHLDKIRMVYEISKSINPGVGTCQFYAADSSVGNCYFIMPHCSGTCEHADVSAVNHYGNLFFL